MQLQIQMSIQKQMKIQIQVTASSIYVCDDCKNTFGRRRRRIRWKNFKPVYKILIQLNCSSHWVQIYYKVKKRSKDVLIVCDEETPSRQKTLVNKNCILRDMLRPANIRIQLRNIAAFPFCLCK